MTRRSPLGSLLNDGVPVQSVCIPNIGRGERRKRTIFGLVMLGVGAAALVALLAAA